MPQLSQWFIKTAIVYLVIGMLMGIGMAMSQDHRLVGAHAHLNLLGWASSALFGFYYNANPHKAAWTLAKVQFWISTAGIVLMVPALAALLLGYPQFEPVVAIASLLALLGALMFLVNVFKR
ncbi:hypothetical protein [Prosthecomicrobium pneumaticum]|uniref:Cbb3-type cytochrome oxidase subunit 1 n=1 Tax=Prosthecomicrobium pneumaticum TaxID=81895 RepID=A0A7W9CVS2_9HYPH|nr:hypothetical protein [Prosthecomicrobium pneumaticum]MBB5752476.1 cbb3-type cytochrome oxidase subunit 1 [Prosthecomicrobium pneumaticum]